MREVFVRAAEWLSQDRRFALATLTAVRAAKPAPVGTTIAVDSGGRIAGNIGAGCYEAEIVETAMKTAADGIIRRLEIDLDADDDLSAGTACGAEMHVVVWRPERAFETDARAIAAGARAVRVAIDDFEHVFSPRAPLLIVGATTLAQDVASVGRRADFRVTVIDPRPAFATRDRLPGADEIVRAWPDEYLPAVLSEETAIVVLSHDPKLDVPALAAALRSPAPYIGLLGSRRAQSARREALHAMGFGDAALDRIHGPVGLDIGGATMGETAISILAEIVAVRHGRAGVPLLAAQGSIH
jgi:xanthine dehydrogenase accessory factor